MPTTDRALLLCTLAAALACGPGREDPAGELDQAARARVVALGDSAATLLAQSLARHLTAELAEGGPARAVDFCADQAEALTDSIRRELGPGWELKRTTLRARNPQNEPDAQEREALERFHSASAANGETLQHHVQRTPTGDYRFYRPLVIAPLCVQCHGPREEIDPTVLTVIDERYPEDSAVGYSVGDLRGLIRVTIPAEAAGR